MKQVTKTATIIISLVLLLIAVMITAAFIRQAMIDQKINDDIGAFLTDAAYQKPVAVQGIDVIKQKISCGYAVLEMFGKWCGTDITENTLFNEYKEVVTSTGEAFCKEMNRQFPAYQTAMYKNRTNSELLRMIYGSLQNGVPVPFEFSAVYDDGNEKVWTLHYAIVTEMDVPHNKVVVANPYGYIETYTIDDFLKATRYESFKNMPFYFKLAFAFGIFEKNTVFIAETV